MSLSTQLKELLDRACARINTPAFVANDPVQFPRMFSSEPDIEIAAILAAVISWGRRPQIIKDCRRLFEMTDYRPHAWLLDGAWRSLPPDLNIHRTCFASHLQYLLRGLYYIYTHYSSLEAFAAGCHIEASEAPAWALLHAMQQVMLSCNDRSTCPEVLPSNLSSTPLKRYNMALRWLVRNDGIVDIGLWKVISPAHLFIPLDVHVAEVSRALGLIARKSNDRKTVELLTAALRAFDPADPVRYDFALFGIGVEGTDPFSI